MGQQKRRAYGRDSICRPSPVGGQDIRPASPYSPISDVQTANGEGRNSHELEDHTQRYDPRHGQAGRRISTLDRWSGRQCKTYLKVKILNI